MKHIAIVLSVITVFGLTIKTGIVTATVASLTGSPLSFTATTGAKKMGGQLI